MENISQQEIDAVEGFVTYGMIRDAANVLANHYVACRALFTGIICCACGKRCETMEQWREHVTEIILIRHTAILKRKIAQNNPNVSQYGRDITPATQDFTKRISRWQ